MVSDEGDTARAIDRLLESTLDSVDEAETLAVKAAEEIGFPEEELHKLGMAVRESTVNAVVHGNRYNARKKVHLTVWKAADHIKVTIADEGNGFDMSSVPNPLAEENLLHQSGRGLLLIRAFVDEFEMRRGTPAGTEVTLTKYLVHKS